MQMQVSTSFVQDQRHVSKSARFVPVQPSQIATVLADHGLFLNHLLTSKARNPDRAHHQQSIARYVARDSADIVQALGRESTLDLLVKAPHLTGAIELRLGFFRGACANQWNSGRLIGSVKIAHTGNCLEMLNQAIPALVGRRNELIGQIGAMSDRMLEAGEIAGLAQAVAEIRLGATDPGFSRDIHVEDLLRLRRREDAPPNLFTVANVLQENALRFGMRYDLRANEGGQVRHMNTRPIIETTGAAVAMTGSVWEAAAALLRK
jgi:hypothetical protein